MALKLRGNSDVINYSQKMNLAFCWESRRSYLEAKRVLYVCFGSNVPKLFYNEAEP